MTRWRYTNDIADQDIDRELDWRHTQLDRLNKTLDELEQRARMLHLRKRNPYRGVHTMCAYRR